MIENIATTRDAVAVGEPLPSRDENEKSDPDIHFGVYCRLCW